MTHLVVLAAFTILGCAVGWCAAHIAGPDHNQDRRDRSDSPAGPVLSAGSGGSRGVPQSPHRGLEPGPGNTLSLGGTVEGPTPPASIPVAPNVRRGPLVSTPRGWDLAPTHPAAPRPQLYDWETDGAA